MKKKDPNHAIPTLCGIEQWVYLMEMPLKSDMQFFCFDK